MILTPEILLDASFSLVPNSTTCYRIYTPVEVQVCFYCWDHMILTVGGIDGKQLKRENITTEDLKEFYLRVTGGEFEPYVPERL